MLPRHLYRLHLLGCWGIWKILMEDQKEMKTLWLEWYRSREGYKTCLFHQGKCSPALDPTTSLLLLNSGGFMQRWCRASCNLCWLFVWLKIFKYEVNHILIVFACIPTLRVGCNNVISVGCHPGYFDTILWAEIQVYFRLCNLAFYLGTTKICLHGTVKVTFGRIWIRIRSICGMMWQQTYCIIWGHVRVCTPW